MEGAAVGAIIGGIVGGGKGAATGAAIGGGVGVLSGATEANARAQGYYGPPPGYGPPPPDYYGPPPRGYYRPPHVGYYGPPRAAIAVSSAPLRRLFRFTSSRFVLGRATYGHQVTGRTPVVITGFLAPGCFRLLWA